MSTRRCAHIVAFAVAFLLPAIHLRATVTIVSLGDGVVLKHNGGWEVSEFGCPSAGAVDVTPQTTITATYPACSSKTPFTASADFTLTLSAPPPATVTLDTSKSYPNNQVLTFSSPFTASIVAHGSGSVAPNPQDKNTYLVRLFAQAAPTDAVDPTFIDPNCPAVEQCIYNGEATITQGQSSSQTVNRSVTIRSVFAFATTETIGGVPTPGYYFYIDGYVQFSVGGTEVLAVTEATYFYPTETGPTNDLTGVVKRDYGGKTYWLPDAPIELLDPDGHVVLKTFLQTDPANTAKSWYRMKLPSTFDYTKDYRLHVKLQSDPDVSIAKLLVFSSPDSTKPIEYLSNPFRLTSDQPNTKNMTIDRASSDITFASTQAAVTGEAGAEVYWNTWREIYIVREHYDDRALTYNLPLEVYLNAPSTFYCVAAGPPTCPAASSIVLQPRDSLPGADPTVLWHEFGHYMFSEIHGGPAAVPPFRPEDTLRYNAYHYGFANSYTTLALDDGFATFWSWISSDLLDFDHTPQLYYNQISADGTRAVRNDGYASEWNWAVWDVRRSATGPADAPRGEEFAIAALLWDLVDNGEDIEATTRATWAFGGSAHAPADAVSIPADQILTIFRNRKPRTLLELYTALKADLPPGVTSLGGNPRNSGLSQLDELFVMQGAFTDTNGNWAYDFGEPIGRASNAAVWNGGLPSAAPIDIAARPWRENVPPLANSFVNFSFPDSAAHTVTVTYNFGPGLETLNSSRQYSVAGGEFYLEMPSPHYPMEVIITSEGSAPLRIENQNYWAMPRNGSVASQAFTPVTTPAPAITALGTSSAFTGVELAISGTNFSPDSNNDVVRFGNSVAYVTGASATQLTVYTPPISAGSAPVTVEVNGRVSNSVPFTINDSGSCRYYVDASGAVFAGSGGVSRIFMYTSPTCAWTIASQSPWIALDRPGAHTGNLSVQLTADPNQQTAARSGTILINTTPLGVYEEAGGPARRRSVHH